MVICNQCGKDKDGIVTGLCNHCGKFGQTNVHNIRTEIINKWWDRLTHEEKKVNISKMNTFDYGSVISIAAISKNQKRQLYAQINLPYSVKEKKLIGNYGSCFNY